MFRLEVGEKPGLCGETKATAALLNVVVFNVVWFACVLGAARGYDLLGSLALLGWLPAHAWLFPATWRGDLRLMFLSVALGAACDGLALAAGLIAFPIPAAGILGYPIWMSALWANFALTLRHALAWMTRRPRSAALLGAAAGPLAYLAGDRLGAISLRLDGVGETALLAAMWGAATYLLVRAANLDAVQRAAVSASRRR